jgi:hypothetical protein
LAFFQTFFPLLWELLGLQKMSAFLWPFQGFRGFGLFTFSEASHFWLTALFSVKTDGQNKIILYPQRRLSWSPFGVPWTVFMSNSRDWMLSWMQWVHRLFVAGEGINLWPRSPSHFNALSKFLGTVSVTTMHFPILSGSFTAVYSLSGYSLLYSRCVLSNFPVASG